MDKGLKLCMCVLCVYIRGLGQGVKAVYVCSVYILEALDKGLICVCRAYILEGLDKGLKLCMYVCCVYILEGLDKGLKLCMCVLRVY